MGMDTSAGFFWSLVVSFQAMLACAMATVIQTDFPFQEELTSC